MIVKYSNTGNWLTQVSYFASLRITELIAGKDPGAGYGKAIYGDMTVVVPAAYSLVRNPRIKFKATYRHQRESKWVITSPVELLLATSQL
jgi:hypothetical protein